MYCLSITHPYLLPRNMLPDISIAVSQPGGKFFHLEDLEMSYLTQGACPFSRAKTLDDYGSM
jgi:hypothetical protein